MIVVKSSGSVVCLLLSNYICRFGFFLSTSLVFIKIDCETSGSAEFAHGNDSRLSLDDVGALDAMVSDSKQEEIATEYVLSILFLSVDVVRCWSELLLFL